MQPESSSLAASRRQTDLGLRVSAYDRASGLLVALLILVGITVALLLLRWLSSQVFLQQEPVAVKLQQLGGGQPDGVLGESLALDVPEPQEIAAETDLDEPQLEDTLALISDAVATRQAELVDPALTEEQFSGGRRGGSLGDGRQPALGFGDGPPGVPAWERWEILFDEGNTLEEYARQLDFFGVELGVVDGDQIRFVSGLSRPQSAVRSGPRETERRLPMSWRDGKLATADRRFVIEAGIEPGNEPIIQFFPDDTVSRLLALETSYQGHDVSEIRKTIFGVRASGGGYEFYVISQRLN